MAGYFAREGLSPDIGRALLSRMGGALVHRGPDDRGDHVFEHAGLASTRLSIIDLEGGRMPLFNEDRSVAVAFNGEIYDHRHHREALEKAGHRFATRADTEVLVHLYEEHGDVMVERLTGMFAFALWDVRRRRLLLARDRFGMKPLFFAKSDDGRVVLFASEAKAILASGLVRRAIDPAALRDVLSCGYPMPPRSMFAGIEELGPARRMILSAEGEARTERWWSMPYPQPGDRDGSRAVAISKIDAAGEALRGVLDQVVREHLIADVPVGSYLSGGIDSVTVAARAAKALDRPLRTWSMAFSGDDARFDESMHAELAARHIGSEHHKLDLSGVSAADYEGTIRAMEAPQVHTVAFCLYQLAREARQSGLRVVLSGEGSDEIFAGYRAFRLSRFRRVFGGRARWIRRGLVRMVVGRRQPELAQGILRWWSGEEAAASRYGLVPPWYEQWCLLAENAGAALLPDARAALPSDPLPDAPRGERAPPMQHSLHRDLAFEQATRLDGWVLRLGDRLTMAHSLELRVPFLDHRVAELAARLPASHLLGGVTEKRVLRRAMQGQLPEGLRRRSKRAFIAPITRWILDGSAPDYTRDLLSDAALRETGLFDPKAIAARRDDLAAGGLRALAASWTLNLALGLQVFTRTFSVHL